MTLRLSFVLKDTTSRVTLLADPEASIALLRKRIEQEFSDLFGEDFAAGKISDEQGFVLSNSGQAGLLLVSGQVLTVEREELNPKKHCLSRSPGDVLTSLQLTHLSTSRRLRDLDLSLLHPEDQFAEVVALGFSFHVKETLLNTAVVIRKLLAQNSDFLKRLPNHLAALSHLVAFWTTQLLPSHMELLSELLEIIEVLNAGGLGKLIFENGVGASLLSLSNAPSIGLPLKARIATAVAGFARPELDREAGPSAKNQHQINQQFLQAQSQLLDAKSYDLRVSSLKAIVETLESDGTVRLGPKTVLRIYNALRMAPDKAVSLLQSRLLGLLPRITKREVASQLAKEGILTVLHQLMAQATDKSGQLAARLMAQLVLTGKEGLCLPELLSLSKSPYQAVQNVALKGLALRCEGQSFPAKTLQPLVKKVLEWSADPKRTTESRISALEIIETLSANEEGCRAMAAGEGVRQLSGLLLGKEVELSRRAARALLNVSGSSREAKYRVIAELPETVTQMEKGGVDPVVQGFLKILLVRK